MYRRTIRASAKVVALDRFMADRLERKAPLGDKVKIAPPWSHLDADAEPIDHAENPFRREHGLSDKLVIMYSGNLSPAHPLDTILHAAERLRDDEAVEFVFIGGGLGARIVRDFIEEKALPNARLLPYQPLDTLPYSLAAADVHLVAMGEAMVGIVHPCKVYGAMAAGRPILFVGPRPCHVTDLLDEADIGRHVEHGDVDAAVAAIEAFKAMPLERRRAMGERARRMMIEGPLNRGRALGAVCGALAEATQRTGG
jgi:glycosyltransferase involved in cell wall biosynthesis